MPHRHERRGPSQGPRRERAFRPSCEPFEPRVLLTGRKVAYVVSGLGGSIFPDRLDGQSAGSVVSELENLGYTLHEVAWNDPNPTSSAGPHGDPGSFGVQASLSTTTVLGITVPTGVTADVSVDLGSPNTPDKVDPRYGTDFVDSVVDDLESNYDAKDTIVLIGYSLGGSSVLEVANRLAQDEAAGRTSVKVDLLALLDPVGYANSDANNPGGLVAGLESGSYVIGTFAPSIRQLLNDGITLNVDTQFVNGTDGLGDGRSGPVNDDGEVPGFRGSLPGISGSSVEYLYNRYQPHVPFPFDLSAGATIAGTPGRSIQGDFSLGGQPIPDQAESATTTPHESTALDVLYGVVNNPLDLVSPVMTNAQEHAIFPYDPTIQAQLDGILDGLTPAPPTAVALVDTPEPIQPGRTVTLDGSQSSFRPVPGETGPLQYRWSQSAGPTVPPDLIANSLTSAQLSFSVPAAGDYSFLLTVTDPSGLSATATASFTATATTATHLAITTSPPGMAIAGTPFGLTVAAEDDSGHADPSFTGTVAIGLAAGPGGADLGGALTTTAVAGVATFSGLKLDRAGDGYTLRASSDGLAAATTAAFDVAAGTATRLVVTTQPPESVVAGVPFGLTAAAEDGQGNIVPSFSGIISVSLAGGPGGTSPGGTLTLTTRDGVATFPGLTLDRAGTGYAFAVSGGNLPRVTTTSLSVVAGAAAQLVLTGPPPGIVGPGSPFVLTLAALDAWGNPASSFAGDVTLAVAVGPGGGSLGGPATVAAAGGVASFTGLTLDRGGTYVLQAQGAGLVPSPALNITVEPTHPTEPRVTGVSAVSSRRGLTTIVIAFDQALDPSSASDPGRYAALGAVTRRRRTTYARPVRLGVVSYTAGARMVTVRLARPYRGAVQVTVRAGLLGAAGVATSTEYITVLSRPPRAPLAASGEVGGGDHPRFP